MLFVFSRLFTFNHIEKKKKNCCAIHNSLQKIYISICLAVHSWAAIQGQTTWTALKWAREKYRTREKKKKTRRKRSIFQLLFMITIIAKENNTNSGDALHFFLLLFFFFFFSLDLYNKRKPCLGPKLSGWMCNASSKFLSFVSSSYHCHR